MVTLALPLALGCPNGDFAEVCEAGAGCWSSPGGLSVPSGQVCVFDAVVAGYSSTFLALSVIRAK